MPLPDPPKREKFYNQEEFEEALGYWQEHVGHIRGMADRAHISKNYPEQDCRTDGKAQAQEEGDAPTLQQAVAVIDACIETVDILIEHLYEADEDQAHEATSVMLLQVIVFDGPDSAVMQLLFPVLDRLQRLIACSNFAEALEQATLFKTQLQEVRHLVQLELTAQETGTQDEPVSRGC